MDTEKLKIGISIGMLRGQTQFKVPVEHPAFALKQANDIIRENYNNGIALFYIDRNHPRRRNRRRR